MAKKILFDVEVDGIVSIQGTDDILGAAIKIGNNGRDDDTYGQGVTVALNHDSVNFNAFADMSLINLANFDDNGYGAFDASSKIEGSNPVNHFYGYQARLRWHSESILPTSGIFNSMSGFMNGGVVANGTVENVVGFLNFNASGAGTILNQYGVYLDTLTKGTNSNWGVYSLNPNYLKTVESTEFKKTNGTSNQFLKADGSVDSNDYITSPDGGNAATLSNYNHTDFVKRTGNVNEIITGEKTFNDTIKISRSSLQDNNPKGRIYLNASSTINYGFQLTHSDDTGTQGRVIVGGSLAGNGVALTSKDTIKLKTLETGVDVYGTISLNGFDALRYDTTSQGLYAGHLAGNNQTRSNAFGYEALSNNTGVNSNGFGYFALSSNTGNYSNGFGYAALQNNTGSNSNGFGYASLHNNQGAYSNGFGHFALNNNTGNYSNGFGYFALSSNTGVNSNGFGHFALRNNIGNYSNGFGYASLHNNQGANNTAIGHAAGYEDTPLTGGSNTFLGYNASYGENTTITNSTAVGANVTLTDSNTVILGNGANVGIGTTSPSEKLDVDGNIKATKYKSTNDVAWATLAHDVTSCAAGSLNYTLKNNRLVVVGNITSVTLSAAGVKVIATLPVGSRPNIERHFVGQMLNDGRGGALGYLTINPNGEIKAYLLSETEYIIDFEIMLNTTN